MKRKLSTVLALAVVMCLICPLICCADAAVPANLVCEDVNEDYVAYVTNEGDEPITLSPIFASYDADGRVQSLKIWSNITIEAGKAFDFNLVDCFDETLTNVLFFVGSDMNPVREAETLELASKDIIFDVSDLYK